MRFNVDASSTDATKVTAAERYASKLLELFYPIHYRGSMALEDAMRGELTRKQAAILWLIRSAGAANGYSLRRKEIVVRLQDWFDVSSPAVTKALRTMARPPLGLVRQLEDPDSGREKRVVLTSKGERFLATMAARGNDFLRELTEQLPEDQLQTGVEFLVACIAAFERANLRKSADDGTRGARGNERFVGFQTHPRERSIPPIPR
jgi:DNA-binding MarR family transcriptional regulator